MQILFISWWWPYPADNGSKIRIYNLLRHLSQHHQITLLSFAESVEATPEQMEHLRTVCVDVEAIPKPQYQPGGLKAYMGYFSPWPRSVVDVYSPVMAAHVRSQVRQTPPDVIIASELQTMRYLEIAPHIPSILEEMEVTIYHDAVVRATNTASQFRARLTVTKLDGALNQLLKRGTAITVVSEKERALLRQSAPPDARIEVIPNGVDTQANQPSTTIQPQPFTLIYNGAVTYYANLDAVNYFIGEVWPRVRQHVSRARFTVTGGTGKIDISALKNQPGVTFSGYLPSIAPAVQASWGTVIPLRVGGGTRLKILESMALGTPVIATRKGAEGLDVEDGKDILLADTPEELTDAICQLFDDPALRARLSAAGRATVERQYDWAIIGRQLLDLIEQVTSIKS
jgi:glycosyltransferase involved in cell wall biosynthesis